MKKMFSLCMAVFIAVSTFAQGYTPMRGSGISAYGVNLYGICVGCYNGNLNALVDADLNKTISMGKFCSRCKWFRCICEKHFRDLSSGDDYRF